MKNRQQGQHALLVGGEVFQGVAQQDVAPDLVVMGWIDLVGDVVDPRRTFQDAPQGGVQTVHALGRIEKLERQGRHVLTVGSVDAVPITQGVEAERARSRPDRGGRLGTGIRRTSREFCTGARATCDASEGAASKMAMPCSRKRRSQ